MTHDDDIKVRSAEALLTALFESHTRGGYTLGQVVARWCDMAGVEQSQIPGLYQRLHEAGGLTVNNALQPED